MAGKEPQDYRIFVGGLSWEVTERQLEDAFVRFGKIIDAQVPSFLHFSVFTFYILDDDYTSPFLVG